MPKMLHKIWTKSAGETNEIILQLDLTGIRLFVLDTFIEHMRSKLVKQKFPGVSIRSAAILASPSSQEVLKVMWPVGISLSSDRNFVYADYASWFVHVSSETNVKIYVVLWCVCVCVCVKNENKVDVL